MGGKNKKKNQKPKAKEITPTAAKEPTVPEESKKEDKVDIIIEPVVNLEENKQEEKVIIQGEDQGDKNVFNLMTKERFIEGVDMPDFPELAVIPLMTEWAAQEPSESAAKAYATYQTNLAQ